MQRLSLLFRHPLAGLAFASSSPARSWCGVYFVPVVLNGGAGVPVEAAIPVAYFLAICLHFNLQRRFVFRHVSEFALSPRGQLKRYCMFVAVQYPTWRGRPRSASVLHLSQRDAFLVVTLTMALIFFTVLRTLIFRHGDRAPGRGGSRSASELEIVEVELLGGGRRDRVSRTRFTPR